MSDREHKKCFGAMFHDALHFEQNKPMRGKVFAFELDRVGGALRSGRSVEANIDEWDDCTECPEFDSCYKFCMAKLLLQTAIEAE